MQPVTFFVPGLNVPQGSKKGWFNAKTGQVMMREAAGQRHASRRHEVWSAALDAAKAAGRWDPDGTLTPDGGPIMWRGPIGVRLVFEQVRNVGDYGSGKNAEALKPGASHYPTKPPDIDKLTRLVLDSLTGVLFVDDAQVVRLGAEKVWVDRFTSAPGVRIIVREIE